MPDRLREETVLPRAFVRMCRRRMRQPKVADSRGNELSGAGLLTRALSLRRIFSRGVSRARNGRCSLGVLLPPSTEAVVVNAALTLDRRVAINLNYSASSRIVNLAIGQAGIRHVLTSRLVMKRSRLELDANVLYLEDLVKSVTTRDKIVAAAQAWGLPARALERLLGLHEIDPDDPLTVMFTSGTTGDPKGVVLTHRNVGSNIAAISEILSIAENDVVLGALPFFHAFGFTTTLWTTLTVEAKGVYHYNPLDSKGCGALSRQHGATILVTMPTLASLYTRGCPAEDFASLQVVFTGGEKLPAQVADTFEKKFGIRPVEGYGATELSPVAAGNIPPNRATEAAGLACREGTVGRPLPGISARTIDPETGEPLGVNQSGMLQIKGPNVMKEYLGRPEATAKVLKDGWYVTGDFAVIDDDGFIHITGRSSRFAKIAGEMIPLDGVQAAILKTLADEDTETQLAVVAVPDMRRGERLIVLHTALEETPDAICRKLVADGLPPVWVPSANSFCQVEQIPVGSTGKLDHRWAKEYALREFGSKS